MVTALLAFYFLHVSPSVKQFHSSHHELSLFSSMLMLIGINFMSKQRALGCRDCAHAIGNSAYRY